MSRLLSFVRSPWMILAWLGLAYAPVVCLELLGRLFSTPEGSTLII